MCSTLKTKVTRCWSLSQPRVRSDCRRCGCRISLEFEAVLETGVIERSVGPRSVFAIEKKTLRSLEFHSAAKHLMEERIKRQRQPSLVTRCHVHMLGL